MAANKYTTGTPEDPNKHYYIPKGNVNIPRVNTPPQRGDATTPAEPTIDPAVPATTANADPGTPPTTNDAAPSNAGNTYTTINQQVRGEGGIGYNAYLEAEKQTYDPNAVKSMTPEELNALIAKLGVDPSLYEKGGYNQNGDGTPTTLPGTGAEGWYYTEGDPRNKLPGTSGADEDLLGEAGYAAIQGLKAEWNRVHELALQAEREGNTELAAQYYEQCKQINNQANQIRASMGYYGGTDGSMYVTLGELGVEQATQDILSQQYDASGAGSAANTPEAQMQALLEQWKAAALAQSNGQIDYAVAQAIRELERALEDAQPQFKEAAESVSIDERQAMDNAALYAEMRGDRGGIGQEQYNSIQNTAAQNRLAIQLAQTKLSTDTARQIEDLRAQGEFEKADKALEITQQYLAQLLTLEQWAAEFNMTQEQFQASLSQWQAEYDMAMMQIGIDQNRWEQEFQFAQNQWANEFQFAKDKFNYDVEQAALAQTAEMGWMLFNAGQINQLTDEQLQAMNFESRADAQAMYDALTLSQDQGSALSINKPEDAFSVLYSAKFTKESDPEVMAAYLTNRGVDSKLASSYVTEFVSSGYDSAASSVFASEGGWAGGYSNNVSGGSYKGTEWGAIKSTIVQNLSSGNFNAVTKYMDQIAGGLSEEQFLELMDLFAKYGYSPYSAIN